jgi:PTS system glucose-specific IIC component
MTSSWLAAIGIGVLLSFIWPPIGAVIDEFSEWVTAGQPAIAVFSRADPSDV